jgi:cystathionine beta-lyase
MKKETTCIHSGTIKGESRFGINTPIFTSSAFEYIDLDEVIYPRYFNTPNQRAVVEKVCALEGGEDGVLFSSGLASISTSVLTFASMGDHVVLMNELYGGTHAFATNQFGKLGLDFTFTPTDAEAICDAIRPNTKVVIIESPTNPLLNVVDIEVVARCARKKGVVTIIDNTFASPINQTPIRYGVDIVVHSGTKYLGGHNDICCGIAVTSNEYAGRIRKTALSFGGSLNAMTCYLLERSLKTLAIRVERQTANATRLAQHLNSHSVVRRVYYPGISDDRRNEIARKQMSGFGGMLSFELDDRIDPTRFLRKLQLIHPAVSLGGVESTICSPAVTSHAKMSPEERRKVGVTDALLRLSVGIENVDDLIEDIEQALT